MRVILDGQPVELDDDALLGEGGEARVWALGAHAVKVFFPGAPASLRALRARKLQAFPAGLPPGVIAPLALAHDDGGDVVGYRMARVRDAVELARLCRPGARAILDANGVLALFRRLLSTVTALHKAGVVVGDLNDGNVLVDDAGRGAPWLIDADSMQLGALPCPVAHERFLDPRLHGVDLLAAACFSPSSDAFALRVLVLQALCFVHPWGGVHDRLPTLLRRAEARHSVFRDDVRLPKVALPLSTLPEALADDLRATFDDDVRRPLSPALLDARYVRCGCGVEHARAACPACRVRVVVPAVVVHGGIAAERIVVAAAIVAAGIVRGRVATVVDDGHGLWARDGRPLLATDATVGVDLDGAPGATGRAGAGVAAVAVDEQRTWLARVLDERHAALVAVVDGVVVERTSTGLAFGAPAFAASPVGLFRLHGDAILHHGRGLVVGRALRGRTWLFPVDDGCLAVWRAGQVMRAQWCRPGGAPVDLALPALAGRVVDVAAVAGAGDDGRALLTFAVDRDGRRIHRAVLVSRRRGVLACLDGAPDDHPLLGNVRGKVVQGDAVLSTSARGLALWGLQGEGNDARFVERTSFPATREFVDDSVDLLAGSGGDLWVVGHREVHLLRRRAAA
jgi:hypothetical protein